MELIFLGTANAFGTSGRLTSHYLIKGSKTILLDAGPAAISGIKSQGMSLNDIDYILLSHLHPDHYIGLPQFVLEDFYVVKRLDTRAPIPLICPIGTEELLYEMTKLMYKEELADHLKRYYNIVELGPNEEFKIDDLKVQTFPAGHSGNARMQLISMDGKAIGYTGDSSWSQELFDNLVSADILITEASSYEHPIPDHTTVKQLEGGSFPEKLRIYLTHLGPSVEQNRDKISDRLILAQDGMRITI